MLFADPVVSREKYLNNEGVDCTRVAQHPRFVAALYHPVYTHGVRLLITRPSPSQAGTGRWFYSP
jgi:hypothetical protein